MTKPVPFGKYFLLDRINVGGMAEVFKAKAFGVEGFERLLAVKRILSNIAEDEEFITMFIDEAKIAVQLQHANIAQIFDLGKVDDSFFIALEFVNGRDLRAIFDHLRKSGAAMPAPQTCFVIMQVCEGLDYAHNKRDHQGRELNLVHRDVSPQNVLIGYDGEIKIVDFGIAKAAGKASKTQAGILKGKFGYMSPEQVRGLPVDRRSDIFALGIVLYELLTGERLFVGESDFSTLEKVRNVEILPPSSFNKKIPAELERIVLKALAKDVEDRYQNAIDLHDDLQAFLYSVGEFYSRKDLSGWMKKTFAKELAEENAKLEEYAQLEQPTPAPVATSSSNLRAVQAGKKKNPGLEWDDEELETQIFDKPPGEEVDVGSADDSVSADDSMSADDPPSDDELTSGDILLTDHETEDKTVAVEMPPEMAESSGALRAVRARQGQGGSGGPPQGLRAFRSTQPGPGQAGSGARMESFAGQRILADGGAVPSPGMFRQTLTGLPAAGGQMPGGSPYRPASISQANLPRLSGPMSAIPERRPLESMASKQPVVRSPIPLIVAGVIVLAVGFLGYKYINRPGKLQIVATPSDAEILLDDKAVSGMLSLAPGPYHLQVSREGYSRREQNVEIQAGEFERLEIALEPSLDTGFELTSEPPGQLVWLDGQPFTGNEPGSAQARTNFKAHPVTPGKHTIEIKGDSRFSDWKTEFFQEPGRTMKIQADLVPHTGNPPPAPAPALPPGVAPPPAVAPAVVPEPPTPAPVAARPPRTPRAPRIPDPSTVAVPRPMPAVTPTPARPAIAAGGQECQIMLGSKPSAKVTIDGKDAGYTPLVGYKVSCGRHKVTLSNSDFNVEKSISIVVKAGEKFKQIVPLIDADE